MSQKRAMAFLVQAWYSRYVIPNYPDNQTGEEQHTMVDRRNQKAKKPPILGQSHGLSDIEGEMIQQLIREGSHSSRELYIPQQDLAQEATTHMRPEAEQVIADSRVRDILLMFNRDYLYGQGRFDEYQDGLLLKLGDGYSRNHIWVTVEDAKLLFDITPTKHSDTPSFNRT